MSIPFFLEPSFDFKMNKSFLTSKRANNNGISYKKFLKNSECCSANGFVGPANHPLHGEYIRHGPLLFFDGDQPDLKGPPLPGQHNKEILQGAGYGAATIEKFLASGVLWQQ